MSKKKKPTISQLDKKLWKEFSRFIKLRDSRKDDLKRIGNCITCGKEIIIQENIEGKIHTNGQAQAGHYISRSFKSVKYEEKQVNLQCGGYCNNKHRGNGKPLEYEEVLIKRHGAKWVKDLKYKALHTEKILDKFWTRRDWYEEKIAYYKEKIKEFDQDSCSSVRLQDLPF